MSLYNSLQYLKPPPTIKTQKMTPTDQNTAFSSSTPHCDQPPFLPKFQLPADCWHTCLHRWLRCTNSAGFPQAKRWDENLPKPDIEAPSQMCNTPKHLQTTSLGYEVVDELHHPIGTLWHRSSVPWKDAGMLGRSMGHGHCRCSSKVYQGTIASSVIRALRMTYSKQSTPFLAKFTVFHHLFWPFCQQERSACHPDFQWILFHHTLHVYIGHIMFQDCHSKNS